MRRATSLISLVLLGAVLIPSMAFVGPCQGPPGLRVGVGQASVLPTVGGTLDYLDELAYDPNDPWSPGKAIVEWDQGRVAVGNGDSVSHWVHDEMTVKAVAFEDVRSRRITVVVAANLYMIFRTDADLIREAVMARLPARIARRVDIAIHADHNHHGPDTAFDVNHEWYELMIERAADAVIDSIDSLRPAQLRVGETNHYFGVRDSRDARVADPTLGVLQAAAPNGEVIATLLSWSNHPEVTLFWTPTADLTDDCAEIGLSSCTAKDRYFTGDFPGVATRALEQEYGGMAMFLNGSVGALITPLGADVWEVDEDHPVGDGFTVPPGAVAPGGGGFRDRNFRRTVVLGEQLAESAKAALADGELIHEPRVSYTTQTIFTRMSNIGFRYLLVPDANGQAALGHGPAELYTCPATGPKTTETCVGDGFAVEPDPLLGAVRVGDHTRSLVAYLKIGPVGMMWVPAEIAPELAIGLPAEYRDHPIDWHGDDPDLHAFGDDYETPGYIKNLMDDEYRWIVGLGNDEMGYGVPISDYRVYCVADLLAGPGTCQFLYQAGIIEYPDAVAGSTCKAITEDPSLLAAYGPAAEAVAGSCRYGQALEEADDHYEETNSVGWDLAEDILEGVRVLTGNDDPAEVNADFPGYWAGLTP